MRQGFTLIELMIVIAIIAIIAAIAIPNLLESRVTANENAAAASLKSAYAAGQTQFAAGAYNDQDNDNRGEHGQLNQLTGQNACFGNGLGTPLPGNHATGGLTLLGREFDSNSAAPTAPATTMTSTNAVGGYFFAIVTASYQSAAGTITPSTANAAEKYWGACAVPEVFGDTGRRVFTITQDQRVFSTSPDAAITGTTALAFMGSGTLSTAVVNAGTMGTATGAYTAPAGNKFIAISNALGSCFGSDSVVLSSVEDAAAVSFAAGSDTAEGVIPSACSASNRQVFWSAYSK